MTIFQCLVYSQLSFDKPTHQSKGAAKLRNFIEMDNNLIRVYMLPSLVFKYYLCLVEKLHLTPKSLTHHLSAFLTALCKELLFIKLC